MANNKQYAKWIDIPDGNGGTERKWVKDEEAWAAIQELTPLDYASVATCESIIDELT